MLAQFYESVRVVVIAIHIAQKSHQLAESVLIETAVFLQAVLGARFELIKIPARFSHADDWQIETLITDQSLQGRKNLLVREIASGAKKYKRVRLEIRHQAASGFSAAFSLWPPNS